MASRTAWHLRLWLAGVAATALGTASRADNQTTAITLPVTSFALPYDLSLAVNNFGGAALPTLQSFASAQQGDNWVMIGGRTNGLHGFTSGSGSFPAASQNQDIWIVDPTTNQSWSRSLIGSGLTAAQIDALSASSTESLQVGSTLYVVGGYGVNSATGASQTFSTLTAVNLDSLTAWVKGDPSAPSIDTIFRTITDPSLQVTGGGLGMVNGRAMLVFGQNFDGNFNPSANGNYTSQVRSFDISDTASGLSIQNLSASTADPSQFRRVDANVVGVMHSDPVTRSLSGGLVALGGVFTSTNGIWTVPVTIGADGNPQMADPNAAGTLKQAVNIYSSAHFGSFSQTTGANNITLFGGISYAFFDTGTNTYQTDPELPFTNAITTVSMDRNGQMTQVQMNTQFPTLLSLGANPGNTLLFGTGAQFFLANGIAHYDNNVIDLDSVMANAASDNVTLGYVFGGIASTVPNTSTPADSGGSNTVFTVTIALPPLVDVNTPGTVTSGTSDVARRLLIENAAGQYVIPAGSNVLAYGGGAVQSGTFVVNGDLLAHSLSVGSGGLLRGTGTIEAPTIVAGTLRPGNSPGTLTFTQLVALNASGTLMLDIDGTGTGAGAGNYSRVLVTGAGSFTAGGTIAPVLRGISGNATNIFTPLLGQRFTVVSAAGGVSGTFAGLTEPDSGLASGTRFDVIYAANNIDLVVTPASYAHLGLLGGAETPNRNAVGAGIDALRGAPGTVSAADQAAVMNTIYGVSMAQLGPFFDQLAGTVHGDALMAGLSLDRLFTGAAQNGGRDTGLAASLMDGVPHGQFAAVNSAVRPAQLTDASPYWARAFGQWTAVASDGNAAGNVSSTGGGVAGLDLIRDPGRLLGIAAGYAATTIQARDAAQARVETGRILAYGSLTQDAWRFDGNASLGFDHFHSNRLLQLAGLNRTVIGAASGWSSAVDASAHYGSGVIVPFGEFRLDTIHRNGFGETGAGALSLMVRGTDLVAPRLVAGGDIDLATLLGSPDLGLAARLAWAHDFGGTAGRTEAALAGAPLGNFSTLSSQLGHDGVLADLAESKTIDDALSVFAKYSIEARTHATSHAITAGLRVAW